MSIFPPPSVCPFPLPLVPQTRHIHIFTFLCLLLSSITSSTNPSYPYFHKSIPISLNYSFARLSFFSLVTRPPFDEAKDVFLSPLDTKPCHSRVMDSLDRARESLIAKSPACLSDSQPGLVLSCAHATHSPALHSRPLGKCTSSVAVKSRAALCRTIVQWWMAMHVTRTKLRTCELA